MYKCIFILLISLTLAAPLAADGLLIPANEDYPGQLMRKRSTVVTVNIHGLVAETIVYNEFINTWTQTTDATFAFPLPANARATALYYWKGDKVYQAVLQKRAQDTNPGTGQGGLIAEVNEYMGKNSIRMSLKDIAPGEVQKVELQYINICEHYQGKTSYRFPLETADFVKYPIDNLEFKINVQSNAEIVSYESPTHSDILTWNETENELKLRISKPKSYLATDFEFQYATLQDEVGIDFFSNKRANQDGHYAVYIRPQTNADPAQRIPQRMIFVLHRSTSLTRYQFEQSIRAIKNAVSLLNENDAFNLLTFDWGVQKWQPNPVTATEANKQTVSTYLDNITQNSGSDLETALAQAFSQTTNDNFNNAILLFTSGFSPVYPDEIANLNSNKVGIFCVAIGDDVSRARLEMLSGLNYGFVRYFHDEDNLAGDMLNVFEQISAPVLKHTALELGGISTHETYPKTLPTTYAGSYFYQTGRYASAGSASMAVAGIDANEATQSFGFQPEFSEDSTEQKFVESLWARDAIDALEFDIEIYGETDEKKQELIDLSLGYGIRCRYTAYNADYETEGTPGTDFTQVSEADALRIPVSSHLISNYPNPFNPSTQIAFYIAPGQDETAVKFIKIYNALGQLVQVINITHFRTGEYKISFNGLDYNGNRLPSGMYFARMVIGENVSTIRMLLAK